MEKGITLHLAQSTHTHTMHDCGCRCCCPDPAHSSVSSGCQSEGVATHNRRTTNTEAPSGHHQPHTPSCLMGIGLGHGSHELFVEPATKYVPCHPRESWKLLFQTIKAGQNFGGPSSC